MHYKLITTLFFLLSSVFGIAQDFWSPIPYPDSTFGYALNVEHSDYIFFGNFENPGGMYRTNPEVINWEYNGDTRVKAYDMAFNSNDVLFLACPSFIFRSSDYGITYDSLHHDYNGFGCIAIDENDGVWAGGMGQILYSNDNGNSWDTMLSSSNSESFTDIAFGLNGEVYATSIYWTAPLGGFYRSLDNGLTWENTGLNSKNAHCLAVNSQGDIFVGCYFTGVYRSTDIGLTWENVKYDIDASSIVIDNEGKIFCTNAGQSWVLTKGIHFSSDNGQSWDILTLSGLSNNVVTKIYLTENGYLYALSRWEYGHQLFRSNNPIVGIKDTEFEDELISVFPNPCTSTIGIRFSSSHPQQYYYTISDIVGTIIQKGVFKSNIQNSLNVQSFLPGAYVLQLFPDNGKNVASTLFVKQ